MIRWGFAGSSSSSFRTTVGINHVSSPCVERAIFFDPSLSKKCVRFQVQIKAAEIKALENKLKSLNTDDSATLKKMLAAEECELNSFDGCAAWYFDE